LPAAARLDSDTRPPRAARDLLNPEVRAKLEQMKVARANKPGKKGAG
jgi:hypothetical protein